MPTIQVGPGSNLELQQIADALGKSKKVVVFTGAGISTNCGIPDFRSEGGLYSMIQAQYDAALLNPPWETTNTFDIDDRPKKKRRTWYYEVVAPDGKVVDVIDEEIAAPEEGARRSSRSAAAATRPLENSFAARSHFSGESFEDTQSARSSSHPPPRRSRSSSTNLAPNLESIVFDNQVDVHTETRPSSDSRSSNSNTISSRSSTPKSEQSSLTSLSSNTPCLSDDSLLDDSRISLDPDLTIITEAPTESDLSSTQQSSTSTARLSRTTSDSSASRTLPNLKGKDLFDAMIWADPFMTSIHYMFISSLRDKIEDVKDTTETHKFIRTLRDGGRLVRNYTQNIDMLEEREGLCQDLEAGPGTKGRFNAKIQKEIRLSGLGGDITINGGCESVPLHGSLKRLRCNLCGKPSSWDDPESHAATLAGSAPDCQECTKHHSLRTSKGRRGLAIGRLRPDIVLYGEDHPNSHLISPLVTHDLLLGPDVLLIMGTSLRVHGLKNMIREFAKAVHARGGKVVFVNQTKPSESIWGEFIDYWVEWDCDEWVIDLRDRRGDLWTGEKEEKHNHDTAKDSTKRWRPHALRDDKTNGVYFTFKMLDTLRNLPDEDGKTASRFPYWPSRSAPRVSDASIRDEPKRAPVRKGQQKTAQAKPGPSKKSSKSAPAKKPAIKLVTKPKPKEPKSFPEHTPEPPTIASWTSTYWEILRAAAPSLPAPPPELRLPYKNFTSNKNVVERPDYLKPFMYSDFASVGKGSWPLQKMSLVSHPPFQKGATVPIHSPKAKGVVKMEKVRAKPTHGYRTRASGRFGVAEKEGAGEETSFTVEVAVEETPESTIKDRCLIDNLVSSPESWHDATEVLT